MKTTIIALSVLALSGCVAVPAVLVAGTGATAVKQLIPSAEERKQKEHKQMCEKEYWEKGPSGNYRLQEGKQISDYLRCQGHRDQCNQPKRPVDDGTCQFKCGSMRQDYAAYGQCIQRCEEVYK